MLQKSDLKQPSKTQTAKWGRRVVIFIINKKEAGLREREVKRVTASEKQRPEQTGGWAHLSCSRPWALSLSKHKLGSYQRTGLTQHLMRMETAQDWDYNPVGREHRGC